MIDIRLSIDNRFIDLPFLKSLDTVYYFVTVFSAEQLFISILALNTLPPFFRTSSTSDWFTSCCAFKQTKLYVFIF
jgi:hypothetical protein